MYVIFPAEELIYMTYGLVIPRIQPRPTLDNLREPQITIDTRPSPSKTINPNTSIQNPNQIINNTHSSYTDQLKTNTVAIDPFNSCNIDSSNQFHNKQSILKTTDRYSTNTQKEVTLPNIQINEKPNYYPNNSIEKYECMTDYTQDRYMRDRSPSIHLEPPSPTDVIPTALNKSSPNLTSISLFPPKSPTSTLKSSSKSKPKLTLSLSRLGRQQPDQAESIRLREDLELHVANPTFTRENLRQRNYDAFFESGEPVYSLEPKPTASPEPEQMILSSNQLSPNVNYDGSSTLSPRIRTLGLFSHSKSPIGQRSRSADIESSSKGTESYQKDLGKPTGKSHRSLFGWKGMKRTASSPQASMTTCSSVLKDYGQSNLNEFLKTHDAVTFKLVKTVSDFTENLSHLYEEHAAGLQNLISEYKLKNEEIQKERPAYQSSLFLAWEAFLQLTEADSQAAYDVADTLLKQISQPIFEKSCHREVQSSKIFTYRESLETIIAKTEEKLSKFHLDYKQCYMAHRQNPTQHSFLQYINSHNAYVQQLHATNAMLEAYHCDTIPQIMQEIEEIYNDLSSIISDAVLHGADIISTKASEQSKRYEQLSRQCRNISPQNDLTNFVRILPQGVNSKIPKKSFLPVAHSSGHSQDESSDYNVNINSIHPLRNELVVDKNSELQLIPTLESLKREAADLEIQLKQLEDSVENLIRTQLRRKESQYYDKAIELQEDLSFKKYDLRSKQIHLAGVKAQKELFFNTLILNSSQRERKFSTTSGASMKTKWLKAFRSLRPASGQPERRNGATGDQQLQSNEDGSHILQEYTYKKITPCDVCSQILRGHTRQGLRCRICKLNSHADCALQLPRCQAKQKLLRRQKSTSEIENRVNVEEETTESPIRHKLNIRMKSLSLDSPESSELHGQMQRRQPVAGPSSSYHHSDSGVQLGHITPTMNNKQLHSSLSPSRQRKLMHGNRGLLRTGSLDVPDDMDKSLSSASISPCLSPVRQPQKSHHMIPTSQYVALYNFKARHGDELDLKAGYKVTVRDTSDPDWWKGKVLGRVGFFPSKYCTRLNNNEKPLQVTHNLQVYDGEKGENMTLLRDQIVIQTGEEVNGMVLVRSADNRQGYCPAKYLQEV